MKTYYIDVSALSPEDKEDLFLRLDKIAFFCDWENPYDRRVLLLHWDWSEDPFNAFKLLDDCEVIKIIG